MSDNSFEYALNILPNSARIDLRTLMNEMARPLSENTQRTMLVHERVQEPVSHLLLGRSEPLPFEAAREARRPAWADEVQFPCWDDPLAGEDEEKLPTVRRPVPITNLVIDKSLMHGPTEVSLSALQETLDVVQDDIRRVFAVPNHLMLEQYHGL